MGVGGGEIGLPRSTRKLVTSRCAPTSFSFTSPTSIINCCFSPSINRVFTLTFCSSSRSFVRSAFNVFSLVTTDVSKVDNRSNAI